MSDKAIPQPAAELIFRAVDDGAVIVKPDSGKMLALNDVGWALWQQIVAGTSIAEMQHFLESHYDVSVERAATDLKLFLDDLGSRELITWHDREMP